MLVFAVPRAGGRVGVQLVRGIGDRERVLGIGMFLEIELLSSLKLATTDVAPWAYGVGRDGDAEDCHFSCVESKFWSFAVIVDDVCRIIL